MTQVVRANDDINVDDKKDLHGNNLSTMKEQTDISDANMHDGLHHIAANTDVRIVIMTQPDYDKEDNDENHDWIDDNPKQYMLKDEDQICEYSDKQEMVLMVRDIYHVQNNNSVDDEPMVTNHQEHALVDYAFHQDQQQRLIMQFHPIDSLLVTQCMRHYHDHPALSNMTLKEVCHCTPLPSLGKCRDAIQFFVVPCHTIQASLGELSYNDGHDDVEVTQSDDTVEIVNHISGVIGT